MDRKRTGLIAIFLFAAVLVALGLRTWYRGRIYPSTDNAYIEGDVITLSSHVPGTIAEVRVTGHQRVAEGDTIVLLDTRDYDQAVEREQAAFAAAQAALELQKARGAGAAAQVTSAQAQSKLAHADLERFTALLEKGSTAERSYDQILAADQVANAQLEAARKALEAAHAAIAADERNVDRARVGYENAILQRSYCAITAPCAGIVEDKSAQTGQVTAPGRPLCRIVRLEPGHVWVTANFKETQIGRIRPGQPATFTMDVDGDREYRGRVDAIAAGSGAAFSLFPPENATGNWVKVVQRVPVRISIDDEVPTTAFRLGLSCEVTVDASKPEEKR